MITYKELEDAFEEMKNIKEDLERIENEIDETEDPDELEELQKELSKGKDEWENLDTSFYSEYEKLLDDYSKHTVFYTKEEMEEFIRETVEEGGSIPENILGYIDWEALYKDHLMDYSIKEIDGEEYYVVE